MSATVTECRCIDGCGLKWILSADALQKYFVPVNVRIFPRNCAREKKSGSFPSPWLGLQGLLIRSGVLAAVSRVPGSWKGDGAGFLVGCVPGSEVRSSGDGDALQHCSHTTTWGLPWEPGEKREEKHWEIKMIESTVHLGPGTCTISRKCSGGGSPACCGVCGVAPVLQLSQAQEQRLLQCKLCLAHTDLSSLPLSSLLPPPMFN